MKELAEVFGDPHLLRASRVAIFSFYSRLEKVAIVATLTDFFDPPTLTRTLSAIHACSGYTNGCRICGKASCPGLRCERMEIQSRSHTNSTPHHLPLAGRSSSGKDGRKGWCQNIFV